MTDASTQPIRNFFSHQRKQFRKFAKRAAGKDPTNEEIHKLRVATRRIRAVLWILRHEPSGPSFRGPAKRFRSLGATLGQRRELDVLAETAAPFGIDPSPLAPHRGQAAREVRRALRRSSLRRLRRDLRRIGRALDQTDSIDLTEILGALEFKLARWRHAPVERHDYHQLRIDLKKVRYLLEALGHDAGPLRAVQDELGRTHDLDVMQAELGHHASVARALRESFARARREQAAVLRFADEALYRLAGGEVRERAA